jgi:copper(I)-binding protein
MDSSVRLYPLVVAPGKPITFGPGGYHVMLTGMAKPLTAGETFPVTLTFANGAEVTETVTVRSMVPQGSGDGDMGGMKM